MCTDLRRGYVRSVPALDLPPIALALVAQRSSNRDGPTADADALASLLTSLGYPCHDAVVAFEQAYGGLQIIEAEPSAPALVVGPHACLSRGPYSWHQQDLVPVMFACDDVVYALDGRGRGWAMAAMVEGKARRCARDGRQLVTQALLWRALSTHRGSFSTLDGRRGDEQASALGLALLEDATSPHERWWGEPGRLVVEIELGNGYAGPTTFVAC